MSAPEKPRARMLKDREGEGGRRKTRGSRAGAPGDNTSKDFECKVAMSKSEKEEKIANCYRLYYMILVNHAMYASMQYHHLVVMAKEEK